MKTWRWLVPLVGMLVFAGVWHRSAIGRYVDYSLEYSLQSTHCGRSAEEWAIRLRHADPAARAEAKHAIYVLRQVATSDAERDRIDHAVAATEFALP